MKKEALAVRLARSIYLGRRQATARHSLGGRFPFKKLKELLIQQGDHKTEKPRQVLYRRSFSVLWIFVFRSAVFLLICGVHEHEHFFEQVEHFILRHDANRDMRLARGADGHSAGEACGYRRNLLHIKVIDIEQQSVALAPYLVDVVLSGIRSEQRGSDKTQYRAARRSGR